MWDDCQVSTSNSSLLCHIWGRNGAVYKTGHSSCIDIYIHILNSRVKDCTGHIIIGGGSGGEASVPTLFCLGGQFRHKIYERCVPPSTCGRIMSAIHVYCGVGTRRTLLCGGPFHYAMWRTIQFEHWRARLPYVASILECACPAHFMRAHAHGCPHNSKWVLRPVHITMAHITMAFFYDFN